MKYIKLYQMKLKVWIVYSCCVGKADWPDVHPRSIYQIKSQSKTSEKWAIWRKVSRRNRNEWRYFLSGTILFREMERSQICLNRWTLIYFIFFPPGNIHISKYREAYNQNKCLASKQANKMQNELGLTSRIQLTEITQGRKLKKNEK